MAFRNLGSMGALMKASSTCNAENICKMADKNA